MVDKKSSEDKPAVQPWKCDKCNGIIMIIIDTTDGIKVICATSSCEKFFPQLKVSIVNPPGEEPI